MSSVALDPYTRKWRLNGSSTRKLSPGAQPQAQVLGEYDALVMADVLCGRKGAWCIRGGLPYLARLEQHHYLLAWRLVATCSCIAPLSPGYPSLPSARAVMAGAISPLYLLHSIWIHCKASSSIS